MKTKGALFIEYALILAFILLTGSIFLSSSPFTQGITSIFNKTSNTLDKAIPKTVDQKNLEFVEILAAYLAKVGKTDSAIKNYYTRTDPKYATLQYATDSEWGKKTDCFSLRWRKEIGDDKYASMVDNLSYAFYGHLNDNNEFIYDVYLYNPENNNGKLLSEYDKAFITSTDNRTSTEVYRINTVTNKIEKIGTQEKAVSAHNFGGSRYNVIRDEGKYE